MLLLGVIFTTLIVSSIQAISADDLEPRQVFSKDEKMISFSKDAKQVSFASIKDSKYQIHLLVEVRTAQGQLISISEASHSKIKYIGYETMNEVNKNLGKKEIITTDGTKFEKVQHVKLLDTKQLMAGKQTSHFTGLWQLFVCGVIEGHGQTCITALQASTSFVFIAEEDVITNQWTILRELN